MPLSSRLELITRRGHLTAGDLCRIALALSCHGLTAEEDAELRKAWAVGARKTEMEAVLVLMAHGFGCRPLISLTPVEWDFWLALRTWLALEPRGLNDPKLARTLTGAPP
jgi:hypothetical protein